MGVGGHETLWQDVPEGEGFGWLGGCPRELVVWWLTADCLVHMIRLTWRVIDRVQLVSNEYLVLLNGVMLLLRVVACLHGVELWVFSCRRDTGEGQHLLSWATTAINLLIEGAVSGVE